MKTLCLLRHAKAQARSPSCSDFDRPLSERGLHDAPLVARQLATRLGRPDIILSSPALRALSTAAIFAEILRYRKDDIVLERQVYLAGGGRLLQLIRSIDDSHESAVLVGHNPALTDLVNDLAGAAIEELPACAAVELTIDCSIWGHVAYGQATLQELLYPGKNPSLKDGTFS